MKKTTAVLMLVATVSAGAVNAASFEDNARVLGVQEKLSQSNNRHQVCDGDQATSGGPGVGTLIGAVAGGLLGAQVGQGNGRVAASAGGAVVGALAGNKLENNQGGRNCYMADDYQSRVIGYNVTYEYQGRTFTDFFQNAPSGDNIKVRVNLMPSTSRF